MAMLNNQMVMVEIKGWRPLLNLPFKNVLRPTFKRSRTEPAWKEYRSSIFGLSLKIGLPRNREICCWGIWGFKVPCFFGVPHFNQPRPVAVSRSWSCFWFPFSLHLFLRFSLFGNRVPQDPMVCHHFPYEIAILGNMIYQIFGRTQLDTMVNARCGVALWWCGRTCSTEPMNSSSSRKGRHRNLFSAGFCPETGDLAPNLVVISVGKVMINHDKPW